MPAMTPFKRVLGHKWAPALFGLAVTTTFAKAVVAEPFFPSEIQSHLGLSYTPPCTLCHATAQGGGPITSKFGKAMQAAGLAVTTTSLDSALDTLNTKHTDSDADGTPDIQQIEEGRDPSTGGVSGPAERYGCGARVATTPVRFVNVLLCAAAVLGIALGRRRSQLAAGGSPKDRTKSS